MLFNQVYSASQKPLFGTENAPECISRDVNFKNIAGEAHPEPTAGAGFLF